MVRVLFLLFFPVFCFLIPSGVHAQEISTDSASQLLPIQQPLAFYQEVAGAGSPIYQGRQYAGFATRIEGHSFFKTDQFEPATLSYDGVLYKQVPMLFDLAKEEVVVLHPKENFKISLSSPRIDYFILHDHTFERFKQGEVQNSSLEAGFYDILYKGEVSVLVKRKKIYKDFLKEMDHIRRFEMEETYIIKKDQTFHTVKRRGAALRLFPDNKKEIRRHLKKNKIKFRRDPEKALVAIAKFYDQSQ